MPPLRRHRHCAREWCGNTHGVVFESGPRDDEEDIVDRSAVVIGRGADGGVYQRTDEEPDARVVYRWQILTDAEQAALVEDDLRADQD